jgi:crotonobetainyl-CoA:carnitine CoA-transferase CaiB-like acyl-CoA transferase
MISKWSITLSVEKIEALADKYHFSAHRVSNAKDHFDDEHLRLRGAVWEFEDPLYGKVVEYGPGPKLAKSPGRMKWFTRPIGFNNEHIFRDVLGLGEDEMKQLEEQKVIGIWMDRVGAKPPDNWDGKDGVFF